MNNAGPEKIKIVSPTRRELDLEVPPAAVGEEFDKILAEYASKAKLAGFRKGKAPRDLVQRMFFAEIQKDVVDALVPKALGEELKAGGLRPVSVPVILDAHFEEDRTLRVRVAFEVLPEFELPDYKKVRLTRRVAVVEDKEVEQSLEELRQRAAEYVPAEGRGVMDGDYVVVQVQGRDLRTKKAFPAEKTVVLAGHAENEPSLDENLSGVKPGEEKTFSVTYPKDHANKKLAGKDVEYRLKAQSIKEKKVPPLNDDLAKTLGDYRGLEDLREKVRARLLVSRESSGRSKAASELLEKISGGVTIELPESLVEDETRAVLRRILSSYPQTRLGKDQAEELAAEGKKQAERNIKNNLILTRIAEKEAITVTDAEVEEEMKGLAQANQVPLEKVVETVDREGKRGDIEENILFRKTVDFLLGQAIME
ncbi:MAG: trigger factor [Candidatus Aminicenantes bacterium]|nr:trigger factor [Candidatus Aminicenantes bacterium]